MYKKEAFWVMLGQVISSVNGLIILKLLTEYLTLDAFGIYALCLTGCTLIAQVFLGGINAASSRLYIKSLERVEQNPFFLSLNYLLGAFVILILVIAALTIVFFSKVLSDYIIRIFFLSILFAIFIGNNTILNGLLNASRRRVSAAIFIALDGILRATLTFIALKIFQPLVETVLISSMLGTALTGTIQWFYVKSKLFNERNGENASVSQWRRDILAYALPYVPWTFIIWLQQASDKWAINLFSNENDVGAYAVLYQLGFTTVSMIFLVGIKFIQPIVYELSSDEIKSEKINLRDRYYYQMILAGLIISILLFSIAYIFHVTIFDFFVGNDFRKYSHFLPWFVFCAGLFGISEVFLLKMQSNMEVKKLSLVKSCLGISGVLMNLIGAAYWGLNGVVGALIAFNFLNIFVMAISARR